MFGPAKGADLNLKLRPIFQSGLIKTIKLSKPIPQALAHHARRFEVIRRALRVALEVLDTPRPPLAVTADKAYDSEKVTTAGYGLQSMELGTSPTSASVNEPENDQQDDSADRGADDGGDDAGAEMNAELGK